MKLIIGLGNPGILYAGTRHNIGFQVIRQLARAEKIALKKEKGIRALSGKVNIGGSVVVLAMPVTFMNLSGEAVAHLLKKYKAGLADLLIVCDDLDLDFGRIRIRPKGQGAGHRGIKSIIDTLGSNKFSRLRVGIGRPQDNLDAAGFVLSRFNRREKEELPAAIRNAVECCRYWVSEGVEKSMNIFNRKS